MISRVLEDSTLESLTPSVNALLISFVCHLKISQTVVLLATLLVFLESP
jgi:hypothetical protein